MVWSGSRSLFRLNWGRRVIKNISKSAQKIESKNSGYGILPKVIGSEKNHLSQQFPKVLSQNKFKRWHIITAQIFFIYLTEDLQTLPALADFW